MRKKVNAITQGINLIEQAQEALDAMEAAGPEFISSLCELHEITQKDLAQAIGTAPVWLNAVKRGHKAMSLTMAQRLLAWHGKRMVKR